MLSKKFFDRLGKKAFKMYKAHIWGNQKDVKENMKPLERAEYEVMTMESRMRGEETRLKQKKRRRTGRRTS